MTGNNWKIINCGFRGIDDYGSGIHQLRAMRVILHATAKEAFASACAFVRFGMLTKLSTLTTAWCTYHSSTCKIRWHGPQFHPFFLRLSSYAHRTRPSYLLSSTLQQILHHHLHQHCTSHVISYCTTSHYLSLGELR